MKNPIIAMMRKQMQSQNPNPINNNGNMLQQFMQFKNQMAGKSPEQMVEQLLQSGQMTQEQFEQLKQQAQMFSNFLK